ncbi:MAG: TerB family tellurite resistance protein [Acidobacteria bacterium]|nr:TerB family tellurite resistance protein [Acidobacteriota bacterium]
MSIWKYLGIDITTPAPRPAGKGSGATPETETVRKIVDALDQMEASRARYIAAFAYLLSRVAHADLHISEEETREMERIVMERAGLPTDQAILVVQMAKTQNKLFGGTENFLVTREFNKIATREQKLALLHCLYAVSCTDKSISNVEDHEIRSISRELKLTHQEFIGVRLAYREYLAVLKEPPPGHEQG